MEEARVPCGPVLSPGEAIEDPHVKSAGFLKEVDYPGLSKSVPVADFPVRLSESPGGIRRRAPTLGEHTDEVLGGLGYTQGQLAELREKRII